MDKRDLRDPIVLGEALLRGRENAKRTLSRKYDDNRSVYKYELPNYSGEMLGFYTAKQYREELETREDIYAKSTLDRIDDRPTFDPE